MTWHPDSRPGRRHDLEVVEVEGELVIWDPVADRVHRLDPVATLVWPHLDGLATLDELAHDLSEVFNQPNALALESLGRLVTALEDANLLDTTR